MQMDITTPAQGSPAVFFTGDEHEAHAFVQQEGRYGRLAIAVALNGEDSVVRYDTGDFELRSWSTIKAIARTMHRVRGRRTPWGMPSDDAMFAYQWGSACRLTEAQAVAFSTELRRLLCDNLVPVEVDA